MNGKYGIGGIFPAMVNVYESLVVLGYSKDTQERKLARDAIDALLTQRGNAMYCQPCVSPIWDTALVSQALIETEYKQHVSTEIETALDRFITNTRELFSRESDEESRWLKLTPILNEFLFFRREIIIKRTSL